MSDYDDYYQIIEKALNEVPSEIKSAAPVAISATSTMIKNGIDYFRHHQPLRTLHVYISTSAVASPEYSKYMVDSLKPKFPSVAAECNNLVAAAQSTEIANEGLRNCVADCMRESANAALGLGLGLSFAALLFEAARLWNMWADISDANIFVNRDFNVRKVSIQKKIDKLPEKIATFADGLVGVKFETLSAEQRLKFFVTKSMERDSVRETIDKISKEIGKLEYVVNGKIEKLEAYRSTSNPAAIGQVIQGAALSMNMAAFGGLANPVMAAVTGVMVLAHFAAAGSELYFRLRARTIIEDLGNKLVEVEELKQLLMEKQKELDKMFKDLQAETIGNNIV